MERKELVAQDCLDALQLVRCVPAIAFLAEMSKQSSKPLRLMETHITDIPDFFGVVYHGFNHWICDVAQLEGCGLF